VLRKQWWWRRVRNAVVAVAAECAQCRWSAKWLPCWRLRVGGAAGPARGRIAGAARQWLGCLKRGGRWLVGPPWWRRRVCGAAGRQCGSHVGGCRLPVRQVGAAAAVVAAAGPWCGSRGGGGGSAVRRVGGAAGRRCGGSAVRRVGGAAGRQCGSRVGGCGLPMRQVGASAAVVAAAGWWCDNFGGVSVSVVPPQWWRQRVGGAAAVVAVARQRCGRRWGPLQNEAKP